MSNPLLDKLDAFEAKLATAGFPPLSPWWRSTITAFFESGKRELVLRVGRRGGKSSSLCRVGVLLAMFGEFKIPPGDVGVVAFISANRDEASQRLRTIDAILTAMGVPHTRKKDEIELHVAGRPMVFRTFAASISGVSGFTAIAVFCDELSKWRDADTGASPATEVLGSVRPTTATQTNARVFLSSSPFGTDDAHANAFDAGDTDFQMVAYAPTWTANQTITEAETHNLEPDPRVWAREYLALPQSNLSAAFDLEMIDRAFAERAEVGYRAAQRVMILDPSSGRGDSFTHAIVGYELDEQGKYYRHSDNSIMQAPWGGDWKIEGFVARPPYLKIDLLGGHEGKFAGHLSGDDLADRLVEVCRKHRVKVAIGDQRESFFLEAALNKRGIKYYTVPWTASSKPQAVAMLRRWLSDGRISLPKNEKMRTELIGFKESLTPNGSSSFSGKTDDYVALLISAMHAEMNKLLPSSPHRANVPRGGGYYRMMPTR